jgi:hypothetical protein
MVNQNSQWLIIHQQEEKKAFLLAEMVPTKHLRVLSAYIYDMPTGVG